ncbi:hypothetical protein [Streptomyces sp. NPDC047453]|uniref:hypothetical protein n=1 Tax=Streptomyces sp. NPDC047453 TaxID=3154812 RepID=UPI0033C395ED
MLLAAPAAVADTSNTTTSAESPDTDNGSTGTDDKSTESDDQSEGTDKGYTDEEHQSDGTDDKSDGAEDGSDAKDEGTHTDKEPTAGTPSPSTTPSPTPGPQVCNDPENQKVDENLSTGLSGLPSKIVAGSGFHHFKLHVNNFGDNTYKRVDLGVFAFQINKNYDGVTTSHLTLQYKDPSTGQWVNISLDENDEGAGHLGYTDVKAKESFSIDLRLSVDEKAPAGMGYAVSIGMYADDKGNCVYANDDDYYPFDVLPAGTNPGTPNDAEPQGGKKSLPAKPVGETTRSSRRVTSPRPASARRCR